MYRQWPLLPRNDFQTSLIIVSLVSLLLCADVVCAEVTQQQLAKVENILQSYKVNHDAIKSGVLHISGTRIKTGGPGDYHGDIKCFMAFDKSKDLLRYDYHEPGRTFDNKPLAHGIGGKVIWSPALTAYRHHNAGDLIQVHKAGMDAERTPVGGLLIYLNLIGFIANPDVLNYDLDFETAEAQELTLDNVSEFHENDKEVTVAWSLPESKRIVSFSKTHGLSPVRCQHFTGTQERLFASSATEWTQENGLWVPIEFAGENMDVDDSTALSLVFRWESVNQIDDLSVFSPESLKKSDSSAMVDDRSGQPIVIGAPSRASQNTYLLRNNVYTILLIVLVSVLTIVLVELFFYLRKRKG